MKKGRILIIDDSNYQRSRAASLLKKNGYSVFEAEDAVDGLYLFKKEKPDLVILDINMPYMEGIEAIRFLKKIDSGADIIMFSTLDDEKTIMEAVKAGAKDYIVKPLRPDNMLSTVEKFIELRRRRAV